MYFLCFPTLSAISCPTLLVHFIIFPLSFSAFSLFSIGKQSSPASPTVEPEQSAGNPGNHHNHQNGSSSSVGGVSAGGAMNGAAARPRPPPLVASHKPSLTNGQSHKKGPPPTAQNSPEPETPIEGRARTNFSKSGRDDPSTTSDVSPSQPATPFSPDQRSSPHTPGGRGGGGGSGRRGSPCLEVTPRSIPTSGDNGSSAPNSPLFDQIETPTPVNNKGAPVTFFVYYSSMCSY